ncbi:PREDICTED: transmembrane 9 superfamily member 7-like [Fragaria vesca subsp. vesca]|uniref:transmembrane 9 superfamily member 7-like n=1 Tax=Fragaria vesca subsp. vesca TaxID=101020 RepID=UPI0002C31D4A|nr:PREDICTED: transmembrane 9 superfamily member 7-like [Fragaria vesca subsp. vesca]
MGSLFFFFVLLLSLFPWSHSFYGDVPKDFKKGDTMEVKVNKLSSTTPLPYDYYSLSYCKPPVIINSALSLGEVLRGDLIKNSVYTLKMRETEYCKVACRVKLEATSAKKFKEKIDDGYGVNMILDDLPAAVTFDVSEWHGNKTKIAVNALPVGWKEYGYATEVPVGWKDYGYATEVGNEERHFIYNHLRFTVTYHEDPVTKFSRIVGFEITPYSVNHEYKKWENEKTELFTCTSNSDLLISGLPQEVDTDKEVVFSYDVLFESSDVEWESRWDSYLSSGNQIQLLSLINSLWTLLLLSGVVAMVVVRNLYKDINIYNQLETQDEAQELLGWKVVHGDVFRTPHNATLLCVCVGNGVQLFGMMLTAIIFGLLGFLSPSNRGGLITAMVLLWMFMGLFGGYYSARLFKMFKGTHWKKIAFKTAFMLPATFFGILFMLNVLMWGEKSSGAMPSGTMFSLLLLWFGISAPLVFLGSYLGFKRPPIDDPVKTNEIPRQIPERPWHKIKQLLSVLFAAILPLNVVLNEFLSIWNSIWPDQYSFGFLFMTFVILLVTCSEMAILLCYFQLRSEDYNWWWRAYLTIGSSGLYMFAYSTFYFFTPLEIEKFVPVIIYFGYMLMGSFAFFVLTGTIGFCACFWFVRKIYSSVKFD